ncbi:ABC transporter ATP-binding protein [Halorubrum sp. BOL3-1]|uniref:ABC transporter ATP-binding protein n=1 Tax=Halorubrum sp. BOL3-1 TaxID=2497325 RepID=UPI0010050796|nr:ABC transporter ATP-binding protein [Halorubrum sp. BOL3-1]QAU11503.1 ABC transporter ATP-binding protein [Halorubrum sp. BOL3-1]
MTVLKIEGLDAGYGDLQILSNVDMTVDDDEYVTIVGPNGAGKSTAMKSVLGLTTYMDGSITLNGESVEEMDTNAVIERGVSYVPQSDNLFPSMTVRENLLMGAFSLPEVPEDRLEEILNRFPILKERQRQRAGTMSGGQQQMLAMGSALMVDPDILLLDEPSAGLAPELVEDMFDRIDEINAAGTAVLMVEQNAKKALRRCDRGYVLVNGENAYEGPGKELLHDQEVRERFLGG